MFLTDLCYEDIVFPKILPLLAYRDWLSLRCASRKCKAMIETFLRMNRALPIPIQSEKLFNILTQGARKLRLIKLNQSEWLSDELLKPVLLRNRKLKCLDLTNCTNLTQGAMQVLTVNCLELERLVVGGCGWLTPSALEYHIIHHNRIRTSNEYPASVMDTLEVMGIIGLRSKVEERKKSKYSGKDDLYNKLSSPQRVSKIKRKSERKNHGRKQGTLLEVDFSGVYSLTDQILTDLFQTFNKIRLLKISNIPQLTDTTMKHISINLLHLELLDISNNPRISDRGLYTVAKYCKKLRAVNCKSCIGITDLSRNFLHQKKISLLTENAGQFAPVLPWPSQPFFEPLPSYLVESSDEEELEEEDENQEVYEEIVEADVNKERVEEAKVGNVDLGNKSINQSSSQIVLNLQAKASTSRSAASNSPLPSHSLASTDSSMKASQSSTIHHLTGPNKRRNVDFPSPPGKNPRTEHENPQNRVGETDTAVDTSAEKKLDLDYDSETSPLTMMD